MTEQSSTQLHVHVNRGPGRVCFDSMEEVLRFAEVNSERVSHAIEAMSDAADDGAVSTALGVIGDLAYQVKQAVELLVKDAEARHG